MKQPETTETLAIPSTGDNALTITATAPKAAADVLTPQACATCGTAPATNGTATATPTAPSFIYAIGKIEPRFPRPDVEKEFAQAVGRAETVGLSDRQAAQDVLSQRQNRYLARQLCWVMTIEGLETYILAPRDPADIDLLIEALRPEPSPMDRDAVVGIRGPIAPAEMCNGLMVPIVAFDQIYSFDRDSLIKAIPRPEKTTQKDFSPVAAELFDRIMLITDNAGATDEHRALNYLAMRYPAIYATAADAFARDESLSAVDVQPSPLSGTRNIVDVIFSYTNRNTDVAEKFSVSVDVTGEFPYLVRRLSPYYDRY
jgi:PatG C-terminal